MAAPLRWLVRSACAKTVQVVGDSTWVVQNRTLRVTHVLKEKAEAQEGEGAAVEDVAGTSGKKRKVKAVSADTSIRYLNSKAYAEGYRGKPVWFYYRRNFKGRIPPATRETCVRKGEMTTASPCPICRDEYLVLNFQNTKLLEQFVSPYTGEVLDSMLTGLCQKQQKQLVIEVMQAWDQGFMEMKLPLRVYEYEDYKS